MAHIYETDDAAIYRQSFATIRREADLRRFSSDEEPVVVRMIHAAGMVELQKYVRFTPGMTLAARNALRSGAPILCDARMVCEGISRARLPADNAVICTLDDARVPALAQSMQTTRSAAALELWRPHLKGALVAIGNAPTALFHLLNMLEEATCPLPAATVIAEPPRRPSTVSAGAGCAAINAALDSAAPTKPTGQPMIAAGRGQSFSSSMLSR